jgi:hypothetical protein
MFVFFVFFPLISYSQELEPIDVDIFLNNFETIMINTDKIKLTDEYQSLGAALITKFEKLWDNDISDEEFNELIKLYKQFINYNPPEEFTSIFNKVEGWEINGYRKYFTLFFGTACIFLSFKNDFTEKDKARKQLKLVSIFGEHDLNIINSRIGDLNIY